MIAGLEGCAAYLDNVIVIGSTLKEHNNNVQALFARIVDCGFRVRMEEVFLRNTRNQVFGTCGFKRWRRPDPEKIQAIVEMPAPKDPSS